MMLQIKHENKDSCFVAIINDETTDVAKKSQLSTPIRYIKKDGNIEERFW